MYQIDIMTLFPDVVGDMLCESVLGRGQERGYIRIECHQIRDYTKNKQRQVDNYPYGGGRGAVMQALSLIHIWPPGRPGGSRTVRTFWTGWSGYALGRETGPAASSSGTSMRRRTC